MDGTLPGDDGMAARQLQLPPPLLQQPWPDYKVSSMHDGAAVDGAGRFLDDYIER